MTEHSANGKQKRAVVTTQSFLDLAEETPAPNLDPFQSTFGGAVSAMADARVITPTSPADIDLVSFLSPRQSSISRCRHSHDFLP